MSVPPDPAETQPAKEDPSALALRAKPRQAIRFRRGLIVGIAGAAAVALVTISWLALEPPSFRTATGRVEAGEAARGPDALADVPKNYGEVPRLGPPLPGDLGRPILESRRSIEDPEMASDRIAAARREQLIEARQRDAAARQAARRSPLLVELGRGRSAAAAIQPQPQPGHEAVPEVAPTARPLGKIASAQPSNDGLSNPYGLVGPASPWTLSAGTIIAASLITGLDSDLPGSVLAQVTEDVRDSATGRTVLIPQGARLIGSYDSSVDYGQRRALLVWTRIVLPDGSSIRLDNMPATDSTGFAGLEDKVDSHGLALLKGIALSTLLGVGTELSLGGGSDLIRAIREAGQESAANAGDRVTKRNLDIPPTIKVRPGWPVRAIVTKDLVLQPWRG